MSRWFDCTPGYHHPSVSGTR